MTGVIEREAGAAWDDLHPKVRERYGLSTDGEVGSVVGRGRMAELTHGTLALPALLVGPLRNTLFPETGTDVPFEIRTDAFRDSRGREALAFRRAFEVTDALGRERTRRYDSTMVYTEEHGAIDFLGTGADAAVSVEARAEDGALVLEAGDAWLPVAGRWIPLPDALGADVTVRDWYDDSEGCYRVELDVSNPLLGHVLGFEGSFTQTARSVDESGARRRAAAAVHTGRLPRA
jgi:hypothetical protein